VLRRVREHKGLAVHVFGSVARGSDTVDSDLDLLVEFDEDATLLDFSALELAYGELVHGPAQTEGWIELQLHIGRGDDRDRPSACLPRLYDGRTRLPGARRSGCTARIRSSSG